MASLQAMLSYPPLDDWMEWKLPASDFEQGISSVANLSVDGVRFMFAFFFALGAGVLLRYTPSVFGRQLLSIVVGIALCFYVFGNGVIHGLVAVVLNWITLSLVPSRAGVAAWIINFPYLALCHIKAGDTWKRGDLDFTGAMMIVFLKLVSIGVNRQDGARGCKGASAYLQQRALTRSPSLWELLAFVFANGNLLGGPYFEFSDWDDFLRRRGEFKEALTTVDGKAPPSTAVASLKQISAAFLFLGLYVTLSARFTLDRILAPSFSDLPYLHRLALLWMFGFAFRMKFYFVWALSEANLTLAGFGFNGWRDESHTEAKFDRHTNGRPLQIEFASSTATLMLHWNCRTSDFLRRYVYEKATFGSKRPGTVALLLTNFVSALWHGVEASYILLFGTGALMVEASRFIHHQEKRLPGALQRSFIWWAIKALWTSFAINYACLALHLLDLNKLFQGWKQFNYVPHIVVAILLLLNAFIPRPRQPVKSTSPSTSKKGQ